MYGLLSGLSHQPESQAYGKGLAANVGQTAMRTAMGRQDIQAQNLQQQSNQRVMGANNRTAAAEGQAQNYVQQGSLQNRRQVFDTNLAYDYAGLNKQRRLELMQALMHTPGHATGWYGGSYGYGYGNGYRGFPGTV